MSNDKVVVLGAGHGFETSQDKNSRPFEGLLMIVNIGEENFYQLKLSRGYLDSVNDAIRIAHAGGHAVVYLYDLSHGHLNKANYFGELEGSDFSAITTTLCPEIKKFDPKKNEAQSYLIAKTIYEGQIIPGLVLEEEFFKNGLIKITGIYSVNGKEEIFSVTEIDVEKWKKIKPKKTKSEIKLKIDKKPIKATNKKTLKSGNKKVNKVNKIKRI